MKPAAILETNHPQIDTIIIWDDNTRLIAIAYHNGHIQMSRPVNTPQEALQAFNVTDARQTILEQPARPVITASRWS